MSASRTRANATGSTAGPRRTAPRGLGNTVTSPSGAPFDTMARS